jgi:uncharacterized integral membrane protein (TIGR00698 family)
MNVARFRQRLHQTWRALILPFAIGGCAWGISFVTSIPYADPLLIALVAGIVIRSFMGDRPGLTESASVATSLLIPFGIFFYGAHNLNFATLGQVEPQLLLVLIAVVAVYFATIILMGRLNGQRQQITYLTATGSAICGASAIAVVSPSVQAEPDDVSISLLAVTLAAILGLFTILPFLATLFDMTSRTYGVLAGSVLQYSGFVKAAAQSVPHLEPDITGKELVSLAMSIKALRYLGLIIAIPLFASLVHRRIVIPAALWIFVVAGLLGTSLQIAFPSLSAEVVLPIISRIYSISWATAMAAIGLNANFAKLLSNQGIKALIMAFGGFFAATATFFIGLLLLGSF